MNILPAKSEARSGRLIAVGDIHGCSTALKALIEYVDLTTDDVLVTLGDYVDRGPDTPGVLDTLIELRRKCRLVPILGNHDQVMMAAVFGQVSPKVWMEMGGEPTVAAYGSIRDIPSDHTDFLASCELCVESGDHIFMHGSYDPEIPLEKQSIEDLLWKGLRDGVPAPHLSGKRAVVGHTSQKSGRIFDAGHIVCIDTYCCGGGWLTALDVHSGKVWQVDREGRAGPVTSLHQEQA